MIPLWRNKPVSIPNGKGRKFPDKNIFPSGRQALSFSLKHTGLTRKDRVAVPDWSSQCVISAVGRIATPIPMKEVVNHGLDVEAVLIYDQWGWPVFDNSYKDLESRFSNKILIHDKVDTSNILRSSDDSRIEEKYTSFQSVYQIFSLSKTLGLIGGGMARWNGKWLESSIDKDQKELMGSLDNFNNINKLNNNLISNFMKFDIAAFPASLTHWLKRNDVLKAYEMERNQRIKNVCVILNSGLAKSWPDWLIKSVKDKNVPGIVPLFKELDDDHLFGVQKELASSFNMETEIYHFDWNGNPIMPDYAKCLALPVHGMINNMDIIVSTLIDLQK